MRLTTALSLLLAGAALLAGCASNNSTPTPAATPGGSAPLAPVVSSSRVVADGVVVPQQWAELSLPAGGVVAELPVAEGQQVAAGDVIVRLEAAQQRAGVAQAEAGLQAAQARLDELQAGPRPEEVEAAQATVDAAVAQLNRLEEGARPEEVAVAQAALAVAQAALQKVQEGAQTGAIIAAQTDVANAEATLRQAQAAYDRVAGSPDIGRLPESLQLEQATNAYNAARARLADLQAGATAGDLAQAQAQVRQAEAQLANVQAAATGSDLAAAQAEVRRALAQLNLLVAGARPETIAAVEAEVKSAQAALDQAQAALADTELTAPFAGTVVELVPKVGELVAAGQALVQLADLSSWQVETDDLTEFSVVEVQVGAPATLQMDAIPGLSLPGRVVDIQAIGKTRQGDVTYRVTIIPDESDPRLRWNMTAQVDIETE